MKSELRAILLTGLLVGLLTGLLVGLGLRARKATARRHLRAILLFGLFSGLLFGLFSGLIVGFEVPQPVNTLQFSWSAVKSELRAILLFGLFSGLLFGLLVGGNFFLRHWSMRLVLRLYGHAPLRYVRFLDYAVQRIFLRKVGGGYIFIHRMLLEYFASLAPKPGRAAHPRD